MKNPLLSLSILVFLVYSWGKKSQNAQVLGSQPPKQSCRSLSEPGLHKTMAFFDFRKWEQTPDPCPFTWSFLTNVSGFTSLTNVLHLSKIKRCKLPEVDRQKRIFKQMLPPPCDESLGCVRETLIDQHLSLFDLFAQLESELHDSDIQVLFISIYDDSQVIH